MFILILIFAVLDDDFEEIEESIRKEMISNPQLPAKICHPLPSILLDCIYRQMFKVCPPEKFVSDNTECAFLKNYTMRCDEW